GRRRPLGAAHDGGVPVAHARRGGGRDRDGGARCRGAPGGQRRLVTDGAGVAARLGCRAGPERRRDAPVRAARRRCDGPPAGRWCRARRARRAGADRLGVRPGAAAGPARTARGDLGAGRGSAAARRAPGWRTGPSNGHGGVMAAPTAPRPGRYARAAHDTGFLLAQLPLAIAGFVLMVLVPSLGVPLLVLGIGVVVLGGLLTAVNGIGELTRDRLRAHGHRLEQGTRP